MASQWMKKRKLITGVTGKDLSLKITAEEDTRMNPTAKHFDLRAQNGRFIRLSVKKYESGVYAHIKLFKIEGCTSAKSATDCLNWVRVNQLGLTMDELIAITGITGSVPSESLSSEDLEKREEFEEVISDMLEPNQKCEEVRADLTQITSTVELGDSEEEADAERSDVVAKQFIDLPQSQPNADEMWQSKICITNKNGKKKIPKKF